MGIGLSDIEIQELKVLINNAVDILYSCDANLFSEKYRVNERTLAHRLAIYIELLLRSNSFKYDVDLEYNRMKNSKGKYEPKNVKACKELLGKSNKEKVKLVPDIIVHERKSNSNIIAIEIKPGWADGLEQKNDLHENYKFENLGKRVIDRRKVECYMKYLGYPIGCYIELGDETKSKIEFGPFDKAALLMD